MSRVIWIVLDSVGMGEAPDAGDFGDIGCNTLGHIMEKFPSLKIPNLKSLGLGNIDGMMGIDPVEKPLASFGRLTEISAGKDTTTGHWEMIGIHTKTPFPTYPNGFPEEVIKAFVTKTGVPGVLCNSVASGTEVIKQFGDEHRLSGKPIIYTSADSVFQIACDESVYSVEQLYEMCEAAREILVGEHGVARVIARPFVKDIIKGYVRTPNRRDFSLKPDPENLLTEIMKSEYMKQEEGKIIRKKQSVYAVGKIEDIFAGVGISDAVHTVSNDDGMVKTLEALDIVESGLIFTNLVEFDSTWGHRRDVVGYARGLEEFDLRLGELMKKMGRIGDKKSDDILVITADHGCDPTFSGTDHTREYVPFLIYGKKIYPGHNLGTLPTFADAGATVGELLGIPRSTKIGESHFMDLYTF